MIRNSKIFFNYLPVVFAFLMPFGLNLSILIILWFVTSWFLVDKAYFINGLKNKWFLAFISLFVFYVTSALLSNNTNGGLKAIEVKMGFLAFPYFFFLFKIEKETIKRILMAFTSGCLFALLFCIGRAGWLYVTTDENYFYYTSFSYFMHAGYFSMYLLFAGLVLLLVYPVWFSGDKWLNIIRFSLSTLFLVGIFLCASKIGLIALLFVVIAAVLIQLKSVFSFQKMLVAISVLAGLLLILYFVMPTPFQRMFNAVSTASSDNIDKSATESTAVRMLIWKQSIAIIKENMLLGVGAGDANDVLQNSYKENGLTGALEHNLNAHNQFIQTFIELGVFGFVLLTITTLGSLIYGLLKKNKILVLFSVIILLNFLVESMLQTQAGNLFYGCFMCLLLSYNVLEFPEEEHKHASHA